MRIGNNPHKDIPIENSDYCHQVIIPVYIPNHEGYFSDSYKVFQLCIKSLLATIHKQTFVTIINNGSCKDVKLYLDALLEDNKIQELIHTENIGKLNAILKGLAGNNIEVVTISDADVLFLPNWQSQTMTVFRKIPKAGVVGIVPQFNLFKSNCDNIIIENLFNKRLQFSKIKNKDALVHFYDSIGWKRDYNQDYLEYTLTYQHDNDLNVVVGSGHFVATYKKAIFDTIKSYIGFKLGGDGEPYLDDLPIQKNYWRLTTADNFAYHMGNTLEEWMKLIPFDSNKEKIVLKPLNFKQHKTISRLKYVLIFNLFHRIFKIEFVYKAFLKYKKLPKKMVSNY